MGISAVGFRGIRPQTVPKLFFGALALIVVAFYLVGPAVSPRLRGAAELKCNNLAGGDYRSFRLQWKVPHPGHWQTPHWQCWDASAPDKDPVSFGWWVSPF